MLFACSGQIANRTNESNASCDVGFALVGYGYQPSDADGLNETIRAANFALSGW